MKLDEVHDVHNLWLPPEFPGLELREFCSSDGHPVHFHEAYQLTLLYRGQGAFRFGTRAHALQPHDVCLTAPNQVHQAQPRTGSRWHLLVLMVSPQCWTAATESAPSPSAGSERFDHRLFTARRKSSSLPTLLLETFRAFWENASLLEQETRLLRLLTHARSSADAALGQPVGREPRAVATVVDYLTAHYANSVSLDTLADLAQLSKFHLLRVFRHHTGLPPHAYQLQLRIEHAKQRLRQGDSIVDTALALGFADQAHLTRLFRRYSGFTPRTYRQAAIFFKT